MKEQKKRHSNALVKNAGRMPFFISGFLTAAWAPLVPYAKNRLQLDEASLGLLLLCLGAGSILAMSFTGILTGRYGCRRVVACAGATALVCLVLLSFLPYTLMMACALLLFGAAVGILDVAQNIHASEVEKLFNKPLMSGFHSFYSIGSFSGAIGLSLLLAVGLIPFWSAFIIALVVMLALLFFAPRLISKKASEKAPKFVFPSRFVLVLGLLCFIMFLVEGALLDWGAIYLNSISKMNIQYAGFGYGFFAVATMITRMYGDKFMLNHKNKVLIIGSVIAFAGLALVVLVPTPLAGLLGFTILGIGAANIIPTLFSEAGRQSSMPVALAMSTVSMFGYSGILAGPALIGFISHSIGLPKTFMLLSLLLLPVGAVLALLLSRVKVLAPAYEGNAN